MFGRKISKDLFSAHANVRCGIITQIYAYGNTKQLCNNVLIEFKELFNNRPQIVFIFNQKHNPARGDNDPHGGDDVVTKAPTQCPKYQKKGREKEEEEIKPKKKLSGASPMLGKNKQEEGTVKYPNIQRVRQYSLCRNNTEKNGHPYISIANDERKSLVIYTHMYRYGLIHTYLFISSVFMTTKFVQMAKDYR